MRALRDGRSCRPRAHLAQPDLSVRFEGPNGQVGEGTVGFVYGGPADRLSGWASPAALGAQPDAGEAASKSGDPTGDKAS